MTNTLNSVYFNYLRINKQYQGAVLDNSYGLNAVIKGLVTLML